MTSFIKWDVVQQVRRMALQAAAGSLVTRGIIDASMAETATGALLSLAGIAWWAFWNRKRVA